MKTNIDDGIRLVRDRLTDHAPADPSNTQTFIAGLHQDRIDATGIISGAMQKDLFDLYIQGILAPTLRSSDVIIPEYLLPILARSPPILSRRSEPVSCFYQNTAPI